MEQVEFIPPRGLPGLPTPMRVYSYQLINSANNYNMEPIVVYDSFNKWQVSTRVELTTIRGSPALEGPRHNINDTSRSNTKPIE